ncbi:unnamed protein product, partial [Vitrella brassicaformis CCMP3155]
MGKQCIKDVSPGTTLDWLSPLNPGSKDILGSFEDAVSLMTAAPPEVHEAHVWKHSRFPWAHVAHPSIGCVDRLESGATVTTIVRRDVASLLRDHAVSGQAVMPGAGFIDMLTAIGITIHEGLTFFGVRRPVETRKRTAAALHFEDISFEKPLMIPPVENERQGDWTTMPTVQFVTEKDHPSRDTSPSAIEIRSKDANDDDFQLNCTGRCVASFATPDEIDTSLVESRTVLQDRCSDKVDVADFYSGLRSIGLEYGPKFQTVAELAVGDGEALGHVKVASKEDFEEAFCVHPALLDGAIQCAAGILAREAKGKLEAPLVPVGVEKAFVVTSGDQQLDVWSHVKLKSRDDRSAKIDITLQDGEGRPVAILLGMHLRQMILTATATIPSQLLWEVCWRKADKSQAVEDSGEAVTEVKPRVLFLAAPDNFDQELSTLVAEAGFSTESKAVAEEELQQMLESEETASRVDAIVYLGALNDTAASATAVVAAIDDARRLVNSLFGSGKEHMAPLWLATRGVTRPVPSEVLSVFPAHAGLWGFAKSARLELEASLGRPVKIGCVDLDPPPGGSMDGLFAQLGHLLKRKSLVFDPEVALRLSTDTNEVSVYHTRLSKANLDVKGAMELHMEERGALSNLRLRASAPFNREQLPAGCVIIRVRAVGLNFRDVLNVMGLYPGDPGPPGGDCSGTVVSVGAGVTHLSVGDDVYGVAPGCLRTYVATDAHLMAIKPVTMSFEQAAALPVVFVTVEVALRELAKVHKGDKVLIHAASGGVGLAAIQFCRSVGATVYGTVGSKPKEDYLRDKEGVQYITSSRNAKQFKEDMEGFLGPNGKIDVVLNCLIEDFIPFSLDLLAPNGRFMELGKRGTWSEDEMKERRPDVLYKRIAVDHMMEEEPAWFGSMLERVRLMANAREVVPLPLRVFDMSSSDNTTGGIAAFRFMQRAQHIGKVIVQVPSALEGPKCSPATVDSSHADKPDDSKAKDDKTGEAATTKTRDVSSHDDKDASTGCYVITGGLGGLGLLVADWLVEEGAKRIVLLSRRGSPTDDVKSSAPWQRLQAFQASEDTYPSSSVEVHCMACDVSKREACEQLMADLNKRMPDHPVKGIFHAAGVLEDALLAKQTKQHINKVYQPKVFGAWHLHGVTEQLDHFVMFSSVAALLGNFGQTNYSAANACLDALARYRRSSGLSGQSIQWGPWIEQGMASTPEMKELINKSGMTGITNDLGIRVLGDVMKASSECLVVGCQGIKWPVFLRRYDDGPPSFLQDVTPREDSSANKEAALALRNMTAEQLREHVMGVVVECASQSLGSSEMPPLDSPLQDLGIDSLGAVEFRNALQARLDVKLPATALFDYPTLNALIDFIVKELRGGVESGPAATSALRSGMMSFDAGDRLCVTGMSCRLPGGVMSPMDMWSMLMEARTGVKEVPLDRFNPDTFYNPDPDESRKCYVREAGFMTRIDQFDNGFFNISPAEVLMMDPQQRLILEVGYEAFHSAGMNREQLLGQRLGVFVGACNYDWLYINITEKHSPFASTGGAGSVIANRVSYVFGLKGPSMTLDTACSSSLVALDSAVKNYKLGECDGALVGGVSLMLAPIHFLSFSKSRMLAPDCKCKTFDAKANGYVRGEGAGAVVLRRASDLGNRSQQALATIVGCAVNHDGRSASLIAPNGPAQQEVLRSTLAQASLSPSDVSYIETHGTGTALGDPIELGALKSVFGTEGAEGEDATIRMAHPLVLGALKTN